MEDVLQTLRDRAAIETGYCRYCEVVDAKNFGRLDEVFTADTVGDYTHAYGLGAVRHGLATLVELMTLNLGPLSACGATHHNVGNFRIDVAGDRAHARANFYAVHGQRARPAAPLYSMWGEYDDDWIRSADGWRITHRRYRLFLEDGPKEILGPSTAAT